MTTVAVPVKDFPVPVVSTLADVMNVDPSVPPLKLVTVYDRGVINVGANKLGDSLYTPGRRGRLWREQQYWYQWQPAMPYRRVRQLMAVGPIVESQ